MTKFIIDFDELHFGELFEIFTERTCNVVERTVGLAPTRKIDMRNSISKGEPAIAGETVENEREPLIAFHIAGAIEEFVEHCAQQIFIGWDKPRHSHFIRKLPVDQAVVICEVDIDLHIQWCPCRRGCAAGCESRGDGRCVGFCRRT